ncbi:hemolysin [Pseudomonas veronii]|uniref:Hemolysin n=2 Tax=Pseudomonas veronii TaxID=76761 RepID=A0A5M8FBK7_PSEVE|nr:hemolysin [Pseudomonas veronii]
MNILTTPPASLLSAPPAEAPAKPDGTPHFAVLADDGNAKIRSMSTYETNAKGEQVLDICRVLITTYDQADIVRISVGADHQLNARINGKDYKLPLTANNDAHSLRIKTAGGNDRINVDEQINIEMHIHGGDGDDFIVANGRMGSVTGDTGNDYIRLGTGDVVAFGGDGDDIMIAGAGNAVISGGKGDDKLYASYPEQKTDLRQVYLNGDLGNDELYAGTGKSILNGGLGDDKLVGYRNTTFYTGAGQDSVHSYDTQDRIYAKKTDRVHAPEQVTPASVEYTNAGKQGFKIKGPAEFVERVEDYLEQLRGSPVGQKMFQEMDRLAEKNGGPVTIMPSDFIALNAYDFANAFRDNIPDSEYEKFQYRPELGYIKDGVAGSPATHAKIAFHPDYFEKAFTLSPLIALYHEMSHAYDGATGRFIPGTSLIFNKDGSPAMDQGQQLQVENSEYQAVGLPTNSQPFDHDNNPLTPPTTANPWPFNENALRAEMNVPLRDRYDENEPPHMV